MSTGCRVGQLTGDPNSIARIPHAAFEHVAHTKFAPNLLHIDRSPFLDEARIVGDDQE
jgi:hypothetical protein